MQILFEDNHLLAINKPAGILTHSDITGDETLQEQAKKYIKQQYNKPGNVFLQPIHRLDRPVSGVILFARTSKALKRMTKAMKERNIRKTYWAITRNTPPKQVDKLTHFLIKKAKNNKVSAFVRPQEGSKKAVLCYEWIAHQNHYTLLEIKPETGRSHQIRAQLSAINCPIVGDIKYGSAQHIKGKMIALHATSIAFKHPVTRKERVLRAQLPTYEPWQVFETWSPIVKN